MGRRLLVATLVLGAVSAAGPATAVPASWLDVPAPKGWNTAGAKIPRAPRFDPDPFLDRQCAGQVRAPISDADRAVAGRGWKLMGPGLAFGDTEVVLARSGVDGMCRPLGYQGFVFSGGKFAGTLGPRPMDSRTDGAGQIPDLRTSSEVTVSYARYASSDPLCCPSRVSTVRFRIDATPGGPVLVPVSSTTVATPQPPEVAGTATAPAATSAPPAGAPGTGPVGRAWRLARIRMMDGTVLVPEDPARYTLELGGDGKATIQADCNRGSGPYALQGASLGIGPLATTRAMCPPGSLSDRYLAQLGQVVTWMERDGTLHLGTRADGAILDFRPAPP